MNEALQTELSRRAFLGQSAGGMGGVALGTLLNGEVAAGARAPAPHPFADAPATAVAPPGLPHINLPADAVLVHGLEVRRSGPDFKRPGWAQPWARRRAPAPGARREGPGPEKQRRPPEIRDTLRQNG